MSRRVARTRIPVHAADQERTINAARDRLQAATDREPSTEELSEFVGKGTREVVRALSTRKAVVSYDAPVGPEEEGSLSELLADEAAEADAEELLAEDILKDSVRELLETLSERERYVIERRYGLGGGGCATLGEIGQEVGVTRERARQMQNSALRKLRSRAFEAELESLLEASLSPA